MKKWHEIIEILEKHNIIKEHVVTPINNMPPNKVIHQELVDKQILEKNESLHVSKYKNTYSIKLYEYKTDLNYIKRFKEKEEVEIIGEECLNYKRIKLIDKILNDY
jgi:hypothetical protein